MIIQNAQVFKETPCFEPGEIVITDGVFAEHADPADPEVIDAEGCYAIPGLIDLHFHGCMGADFCDADRDAISRIARYEASVGVTTICPATMTIAEEELLGVMRAAKTYKESKSDGAKLAGIHMEGPFISEKKKGAHVAKYIRRCDAGLYRRLQEASGGLVKIVSLAPETEGALEFIETVGGEVMISLAHTTADYETASEAFQRGAGHVTHLFNAMLPWNHRDPGLIGAAYDAGHCRAELICDGVHIHPSMVRAAFALFGAERMILISDSMRAAGMTDGEYTLGGQKVYVNGAKAVLEDGTIAGSATNLMECMRKAVREMGIPLETAVACATRNPAKALGIYETCGSITPGKAADLVLLDAELRVKAVYIDGVKVTVHGGGGSPHGLCSEK